MSFAPCELEFIAENENIRIVPNFSLKEFVLIGGSIGPFNAGLPIKVPVWLAINLRQRSKCRILIPDWMDVTTLQRIKDDEIEQETFTKMPSEHYMILGKILFETCPGEIPNSDELRNLLKDIWDIRTSKFKKSIAAFLDSGLCHAKLNNLTQMEISSVRPFFPHALEQLFRLTRDLNSALASTTETPTQDSSQSNSRNDSQNTFPSTMNNSTSVSISVDSQTSSSSSQNQSQSQNQ